MLGGGGGGGGGHGGRAGDVTFFQNLLSNFLPTGKSFQSNAPKFPRADKFYQGKVREKQKFFKVREKSGNSVFWRNASRLAVGL